MVTTVDDGDHEWLSKLKWQAHKDGNTFYARHGYRCDGTVKAHRMHILIWEKYNGEIPAGAEIDHIDRDGLNNQMYNLRMCTTRQNQWNSMPRFSKYKKGVRYSGGRNLTKPWSAKIVVDGKGIHLGCFFCEDDAAMAYDEAARKYFGEFARTNFNAGGS